MRTCPFVRTTGAVLLLSITAASPAAAQRQRQAPSPNSGRGFLMIGAENADLDALNAALARRGYPAFSETFLTLGGGGFAVRDRLLIGGEGHALLQSQKTTAGGEFRTGVVGGYGLFNIGYQVHRGRRLSVYPLLGIGGGGTTLSIHERATVSFDDVLRSPRRGVELTNGALLLSAAIGADYFATLSTARRGGIILGVRAGFNHSPLDGGWSYEGGDVAGGPDSGITGPYIRMSIGGGRR